MSRLALEGVRIIDMSHMWAGPMATGILADMGAEVIKVESIQRLDMWRGGAAILMGRTERPHEGAPPYNAVNRNKYGITLDLANPRGVEIFKELVKISDVVFENYSPRVMKDLGLDYPALKQVKPEIIMLSMPAFGMTGPWRDYAGFASNIEQVAGIAQLTGYPDGPPRVVGTAGADPLAGLNAAFAVLAALKHRRRTGKGQYIDLSQAEAIACLIGEAIVDYSMNKRVQPRRGNRHPSMAPHGCYRCKGDDMWATIAVSSDAEWTRFCQAIGNPSWTDDERFSDALGRWQNQDELDKRIEEWTSEHDHYEVMHILQKADVAAGALLNPAELLEDPHLKARGFFEVVDRDVVGKYPYPRSPIRLSKTKVSTRIPAPCLGEHNEYVLGQLLGMSKEEMAQLAEEKIIGTEPVA